MNSETGFWARLPHWARPPQLDDEIETERARLLWTLLSVLLLLVGPFMAAGVLIGPTPALAAAIYLAIAAFSVTCLSLIRAGRLTAAATTYVATHWTLLVAVTMTYGGISESHAAGLIIVTIFAGLTLGARAGLGVAALSVAAIVVLTLLERAGRLPTPLGELALLDDATSLIANLVLGTVFVSLSVQGLTNAVRRQRESAARYRALAEQGAALGALGQQAVRAPSGEHLAEEAASIIEVTLRAPAVAILEPIAGGFRALAVRGVDPGVAAALGRSPAASGPAALFEAGLPGLLPPGPVVAAAIPSRRGPSGLVAVVLPGRAPEGAVGFVETVGGLIGSALERDEAQRQLRQAQKMEIVGRLAGGVAHDFNNLLTSIGGCAAMLVEELAGDEARRGLARDILTASERAALLTRRLLMFSRKQVMLPERIDVAQLVEEFRAVLQRLLRADVLLEIDAGPASTIVNADRSSLEQVLLNLVVNARDAMPRGGRLVVSTRLLPPGEGNGGRGWVVLSVRDTGHGMDLATRERIFEPFFTTKTDGTGLGLATVLDIVNRSGGRIEVRSQPTFGTTFDVFFPALAAGAGELPAASLRRAPRGTETLLVVDDDAVVRSTTRRILERAGYAVLEAGRADAAFGLLASHQEIALVLSDVVMPERSGLDLARELGERGMPVLLLSGYAEALGPDEAWPFLAKPFTPTELLARVREVLDARKARTTP